MAAVLSWRREVRRQIPSKKCGCAPAGNLIDIKVPPVFARDGRCHWVIYYHEGEAWTSYQARFRQKYWELEYQRVTEYLLNCCVERLNACLEKAFVQGGDEAGRERMSAESIRCLERFSPDYEAKAAAGPSVAQTGPPPQERKEEEITRMRQAAARCESDLARVRIEQDQCVQQAQLTTQTDKTEITRLTAQVTEGRNKSVR